MAVEIITLTIPELSDYGLLRINGRSDIILVNESAAPDRRFAVANLDLEGSLAESFVRSARTPEQSARSALQLVLPAAAPSA